MENSLHFKSYINDYFITITLDEEEILIIIYNTITLDNIKYEISLDINDMKNISNCFNTFDLNAIYNILINLITQKKLKLEKKFNDLVLSFLIADIGYENNNSLIQLILFGEKDSNEYLNILTNEIKALKNQINELNNQVTELSRKNNEINARNNQMIFNNNNNNNTILNKPKIMYSNQFSSEMDSNEIFNNLNIDINDNITEIKIDKKFIGDKIFFHLSNYQLNKLKHLSLSYNKIIELKDIENSKFPNLELLFLNNNNINNLTNLSRANFPELKKLWLSGNDIIDISPLSNSNFNKLTDLSLSKNEIVDITPLKNFNFPYLRLLLLDNNEIKDISIFQYTNFKLQKLGLNDNKISNIGVFELGDFKSLTLLYLYDNLIVDASPLGKGNFAQLKLLSLYNNKIKDINFLTNPSFTSLKELYLSENEISNLNVFDRINLNLEKLYISQNIFNPNDFYEIILTLQTKIKDFHYNNA